jgi:hypothetical protein
MLDRLVAAATALTPPILAVVVVVGWVVSAVLNAQVDPDVRAAAVAVLAFYFGGIVHSNGVASGANAANGITTG